MAGLYGVKGSFTAFGKQNAYKYRYTRERDESEVTKFHWKESRPPNKP